MFSLLVRPALIIFGNNFDGVVSFFLLGFLSHLFFTSFVAFLGNLCRLLLGDSLLAILFLSDTFIGNYSFFNNYNNKVREDEYLDKDAI